MWAEAYFLFNTGMPTLAPTEPPFEPGNERNKPSWRLGFEVLLKSLRFSPCGPLSAAPNKRGFVRSATEALVRLVGRAFLCWILGGLSPVCNEPVSPPLSHCQTRRQRDRTQGRHRHPLHVDILRVVHCFDQRQRCHSSTRNPTKCLLPCDKAGQNSEWGFFFFCANQKRRDHIFFQPYHCADVSVHLLINKSLT